MTDNTLSGPIKFILWSVTVLCSVAGLGYILIVRMLNGSSDESAAEITVTPNYAEDVRTAGYPISVQRAFAASSYGGWHGDGGSVSAYLYPPSESDALIAALKRKEPDFEWAERRAEFVDLGVRNNLLPADFLPSSKSSILLEGRPRDGLHTHKFIVDRSRGILYSISNRF